MTFKAIQREVVLGDTEVLNTRVRPSMHISFADLTAVVDHICRNGDLRSWSKAVSRQQVI